MDLLAQTESVFALSNGHIGVRGNLDEGDPHGLPGTYLGSFYELRPLPSRGGALRRAGPQPDRRQRDQRQAHPIDGRRRSLRRPVRLAAPPPTDAGPAGRNPAAHGGMGVTAPAHCAGTLHPAGVVYPAIHLRGVLRGRAPRSGRPGGDPVGAVGQRGVAGRWRRPAWSSQPGAPAGRRRVGDTGASGSSGAPHPAQRLAYGGHDGSPARGRARGCRVPQ